MLFWGQKLMRLSHPYWGGWYATNRIYKFAVGDNVHPGWSPGIGYGEDPEGTIVGHTTHSDGTDLYTVKMTKAHLTDTGKVRVTEIEKHFKWNIEHQFRRTRKRVRHSPLAVDAVNA
jgi:hypothetical protein